MLHHGKHVPVPPILKSVTGIKFESSFFLFIFYFFLSLNMCCYLCSTVNKILAHVISKSFSFHFIQIKKTSKHLRNSGCI